MQALFPTLYFGQSIVATNETYPLAKVMEMMQRYRVSSACLPTETLTNIRQVAQTSALASPLKLRSIAALGNSLQQDVVDWCQQTLQVMPNETFGTAQTGQILGHSQFKWPTRALSMGKPYPGHRLALIDPTGVPVKPGEVGEIALNRFDQHGHPDPGLFQGFWRQTEQSEQAFLGDWFRTGLFARMDQDGYYWRSEPPVIADPSKLPA